MKLVQYDNMYSHFTATDICDRKTEMDHQITIDMMKIAWRTVTCNRKMACGGTLPSRQPQQ